MKKTMLLAVMFLAFTSVSAFAAGPYLAADLGLAIFHDSDGKDPSGTANIEYDMGFGFDVAGGYAFNESFRAEAELGYRKADVDTIGGASVSSSSLGVLSIMANGFYDFSQLKLPVTPYVGVGAGFLNGKVKAPGVSKTDTTFGYQLMLGVNYPLNKNISINGGYKLQGAISDFEKDNTEVSYLSSTLLVGARFNF